ncbi:MAG: type II toxin-antitoxin system VapC family toxin [Candidatus Micrarchaeota archaeon]
MTVTFDSYAWIEYFGGSTQGAKVREIVLGQEQIYTPALGLVEIKSEYMREKKPYDDRINFIIFRSSVVDLNADIALHAADLMQKEGLHMADSIIYATARHTGTELLTGDKHLKGKKGVIFLE